MGRWDHLYDAKSRPVGDYLLDELAKDFERDIRQFPPVVESWDDPAAQARYGPLLASGVQPTELAVRTALWLARADLRREFEAVDQFMRGGGLDEKLGSAEDRELCRFLWRFFVDKCLEFSEASQSRFKHADLAEALSRLEKRLFKVTLNKSS
jgi:hypothetical protein